MSNRFIILWREFAVPAPLLATKHYFPAARSNLVPNPRLVEGLDAGLRGPLTLISAPAGFGKTSLMSEWRRGIVSKTLVAWLSLDEGDNNPTRFWLYLIAALEALQRNSFETTHNLLQSSQPVPSETIISSIVLELEPFPNDHVLALDAISNGFTL
jgi:LuxR family maltose regulon positive regulatory protein